MSGSISDATLVLHSPLDMVCHVQTVAAPLFSWDQAASTFLLKYGLCRLYFGVLAGSTCCLCLIWTFIAQHNQITSLVGYSQSTPYSYRQTCCTSPSWSALPWPCPSSLAMTHVMHVMASCQRGLKLWCSWPAASWHLLMLSCSSKPSGMHLARTSSWPALVFNNIIIE